MQLNYDDSTRATLYGGGGYTVKDGNTLKPRVSHFPSRVHNSSHHLIPPSKSQNWHTC